VIALYRVPSVVNVYGLSNLVCNRSVYCAQCCQCLWIVLSCLWSFCILCPVQIHDGEIELFKEDFEDTKEVIIIRKSKKDKHNTMVLFVIALYLVSSVANVYGLSSLVCDRSVSCTQCCQCLWIVQSCLWSFCDFCPVLPMSMDYPVLFVIALYLVPSVANFYELFSLVCDRSVSCTQCC
jgi:hypothetical protein